METLRIRDEYKTPKLVVEPMLESEGQSPKEEPVLDVYAESTFSKEQPPGAASASSMIPEAEQKPREEADGSDIEPLFELDEQTSKLNQPETIESSNVEPTNEVEAPIAAAKSEVKPEELFETAARERIADLLSQEQLLRQEVSSLQASHTQVSEQLVATQKSLGSLVSETLVQLEQRKQALQISVEQLERRQERIRAEMRTTFAGASQELAIRVQGFKDYLTGSLQDLAVAAEQLELVPKAKVEPEPLITKPQKGSQSSSTPQFAEQQFHSTTKQIRRLIDQYRTKPDYYGPPWQLRRTFEPVHAERVANWFFTQGGRGALRTMGSRLQNILIGSAVISISYSLYGDRLRTLVLANTPERLGEWRRGLQDCLGISRGDFGPERGVVLFEAAEAVAMKAERLVKANQMPLIVVDDSEDQISLSLLQFPLWLAFAPDPQTLRDRDRDYYDF
ncbi:MAG: DUF3086 domain-containing protein [Chroococcidiopsidaceae cyanobacterium CP_BM_ER_R8_30]|nr:DUF3086 domain-containing protein [Chroococcidiopsidaceae cyanobacterium CP_BM_ER_R8_30]